MLRKKSKKANKLVASKIAPKTDSVPIKKTKIRVVGIGGGGCSIVSEIASKMVKATFAVANTDSKSLKTTSRKAIHFQFGQLLTLGLGTGMNTDLAMEASLNEKEKIKKLLENQDLCILVASLGGGTGSGAAPVFAKISKRSGNLTYGIFTLPFAFEGKKKMEIARTALEKLKKEVDILSIIPNERIFQIIDKKTPLKQALSVINKNLAESLGGLIKTIYEPGLINIDFADLRTIFQGSGKLAYLNTIEVQKRQGSVQDLVQEVIEKAINNPLYPYNIQGVNRILFNIVGGKELLMDEVNQILAAVSKLANREAKIIFGIKQDKKHAGLIEETNVSSSPLARCGRARVIKVSLLAVGCSQKNFFDQLGQPDELKTKPAKKRKKRLKEENIKKTEKSKSEKKKIKVLEKAPEAKDLAEVKLKDNAEENKTAVVVFPGDDKVRKNALLIAEEAEKEMLEKEKFWEEPPFLRKKTL